MKNHSSSGLYEETLSIFSLMRRSGVQPDHHTFPAINRAIASLSNHLPLGEAVHSLSTKLGLGLDLYFCNSMMEVYSAHDRTTSARRMFDEMPTKDVVSWTSIISALSRPGNLRTSLPLFKDMLISGIHPNPITMLVLLRACSSTYHLLLLQLHGFSTKSGLFTSTPLQNSLMAAFCKTHHIQEAEKIFHAITDKDLVSWNIMISGYCSSGNASMVVQSFIQVHASLSPSPETLTLVLSSCTKNKDLLTGMQIHCQAIKISLIDDIVEACLLDLYIKCGVVSSARSIFLEPRSRKARHHLLSTMISGLALSGRVWEALDLIREKQIDGPGLSDVLGSVLKACSHQSSLLFGKSVHGFLLRKNWCGGGDQKRILQTCLISMYSKCGDVILAERCFTEITHKDLVAWSSMIEGYAAHGLGQRALDLYHRMTRYGIRPNNVTFLSVLSACSHAGMVEEGCRVFSTMVRYFGVNPEVGHVTCLVDMLGRSGKLDEAFTVAREGGVDGRTWGALLSACSIHGGAAKLAAYAAEKVGELEPGNVGYGVVMCNVYSAAERWAEAAEMRKGLVVEEPAWSTVGDAGVGGCRR